MIVEAGLNSFTKAVKEAKRRGISSLLLKSGVHDEKGEKVTIDFALNVLDKIKTTFKLELVCGLKERKRKMYSLVIVR